VKYHPRCGPAEWLIFERRCSIILLRPAAPATARPARVRSGATARRSGDQHRVLAVVPQVPGVEQPTFHGVVQNDDEEVIKGVAWFVA
jgi:hypothetical protein